MTDIANLWNFDLCRGSTDHPRNGACLYDAANWILYGTVGDDPPSACPVIRAYAFRLNDLLPDDQRQRLKLFILRVVDNRDPANEAARAAYLAEQVSAAIEPMVRQAARGKGTRDYDAVTFANAAAAHLAAAEAARAKAVDGDSDWQDVGEHAANAVAAAAKAARSAAARRRIFDAAIATLDGVLKIGKQADPFDEAQLRQAIALFDSVRLAEEPVGIA